MIYSLIKIDEDSYAVRWHDDYLVKYAQPSYVGLFRKIVGVDTWWLTTEYIAKYCYLPKDVAFELFQILCEQWQKKELALAVEKMQEKRLKNPTVLRVFSANSG